MIEILTVLLITIILLTFSIPNFKSIFQHSQTKITRSQLLQALQFARNEAVLRNATVTVCKSRDQKTCSGEWQDGLVVISAGKALFSFKNNAAEGVLHWRAFPSYLNHMEFLPSGLSNFENASFWYCLPGEKESSWAIMLNKSGRARVVESTINLPCL